MNIQNGENEWSSSQSTLLDDNATVYQVHTISRPIWNRRFETGWKGCVKFMVILLLLGGLIGIIGFSFKSRLTNIRIMDLEKETGPSTKALNDPKFSNSSNNDVEVSLDQLIVARIGCGILHLIFTTIYWISAWVLSDGQCCKRFFGSLNLVSYCGVLTLTIFVLLKLKPNFSDWSDYTTISSICFGVLCAWETIGLIAIALHLCFRTTSTDTH